MRLIKIFLLTPIVKLSCTWLQRAMRFSPYDHKPMFDYFSLPMTLKIVIYYPSFLSFLTFYFE